MTATEKGGNSSSWKEGFQHGQGLSDEISGSVMVKGSHVDPKNSVAARTPQVQQPGEKHCGKKPECRESKKEGREWN